MHKKSLKVAIFITILLCVGFSPTAETTVLGEQLDFNVIIGEWVRPDGGYVVQVRDIKPDGSVDVGYFNPNKINISEANVSMWKGLVKLYIKLQDKGYPGSTYTLYYYPEKDALAGFYYQAAIGQTFKVVFIRKSNR